MVNIGVKVLKIIYRQKLNQFFFPMHCKKTALYLFLKKMNYLCGVKVELLKFLKN